MIYQGLIALESTARTHNRLRRDPRVAEQITLPNVVYNSLIESFAIHFRAIYDFAYSGSRARTDDVIAEDFFADPAKWQSLRPSVDTSIESERTRVGKMVAHFTYVKAQTPINENEWDFARLINPIYSVMKSFIANVPDDLIVQDLRSLDLKDVVGTRRTRK